MVQQFCLIISGKKLSPSQLAIVQLMSQLTSDADTLEIERSIKQDATLGLSLLKLVNTPAVGVGYRIESLRQALATLGRRQLQRWLQILLYADTRNSQQSGSPLLLLATTRGKLLELIAQHVEPKNRTMAETAFTVGMMSLMDSLFGLPTEKILEHIPVVDEIANALLHRTGFYGDLLKLVEYVETIEESRDLLVTALQKLKLTNEDLYKMQLNAFEWSNSLTG